MPAASASRCARRWVAQRSRLLMWRSTSWLAPWKPCSGAASQAMSTLAPGKLFTL